MIGTLRRRARLGQTMPFALTWDDEIVGMLTVNGITWGSARWASMGYWVAQSHAGRGVTPTAVALVCDHLLTTVGLHRIEIAIRPENAASLRVVEKLGFTEVGLAPAIPAHRRGLARSPHLPAARRGRAAGVLDARQDVVDTSSRLSHPPHKFSGDTRPRVPVERRSHGIPFCRGFQ